MKKIILVVMLILSGVLLSNLAMAEVSMNINSIMEGKYTDEKIKADITITNTEGLKYIQRVYLDWSQLSWLECSKGKQITAYSRKYICEITITPFMNVTSDVFVNVQYKDAATKNIETQSFLLGTFDFEGTSFPAHNNCIFKVICVKRDASSHECILNRIVKSCVSRI